MDFQCCKFSISAALFDKWTQWLMDAVFIWLSGQFKYSINSIVRISFSFDIFETNMASANKICIILEDFGLFTKINWRRSSEANETFHYYLPQFRCIAQRISCMGYPPTSALILFWSRDFIAVFAHASGLGKIEFLNQSGPRLSSAHIGVWMKWGVNKWKLIPVVSYGYRCWIQCNCFTRLKFLNGT